MTSKTLLCVFVLCFLLVSAGGAAGQGLLGERYILVTGGIIIPSEGEDPEIEFDTFNPAAGIEFHLPVYPHVDVFAGYSFEMLSYTWQHEIIKRDRNVKSHTGSAGFVIYSSPFENVNVDAFVGAWAGAINVYLDTGTSGISETDFLWGATGGMEIALGSKAAIRPSLGFIQIMQEIENCEDGAAALDFNYWISERIFTYASSSITFDEQDVGFLGGIGVGF